MYYFMDQQMLHETYWYFKKHTKKWTKTEDERKGAKKAMDYARALLTKNKDDNTSIINLTEEIWRILDPSGQLLDWASQCLWMVVKTPK
jgi:hypothetical protein